MRGKAKAPTTLVAQDELVRDLYTRTFLHAGGDASLVLGVTSALDQEGKTTIALNLASVLARDRAAVGPADGQDDVVIVDCHRSRVTASDYLGLAPGPGLTDFLKRRAALDEILAPTGRHVSVVRLGDDPVNFSVLIRTDAMRDLVQACRKRFRLTVLDLPSMLTTSDSQILAGVVDRLLLVVRAGFTPAKAISDSLARVDPSKFVGIVLNDTRRDVPAWLESRF